MRAKRQRLKRLSRSTGKQDEIKVHFRCDGVTPEPIYQPGEIVIHWLADDSFVREVIGESGRSKYHEHEKSTPP